jgi:hypothetical protein
MAFPISRGVPCGPGQEAQIHGGSVGGPAVSGARSGVSQELVSQALFPSACLEGRTSFATVQHTPLVETARQELHVALQVLGEDLRDVDENGDLAEALADLPAQLQRMPDQQTQMLGHGKRWLTLLLRALHGPSPPDLVIRRQICRQLARDLHGPDACAAKAFGEALTHVRDSAPGGAQVKGLRDQLHEYTLAAFLSSQSSQPRANTPADSQRIQAMRSAFGFGPGAGQRRELLPRVDVEELNAAAEWLERQQAPMLFLCAHQLLKRFNASYSAIFDQSPPLGPVLSPVEEGQVKTVLTSLEQALRFNLSSYLQSALPTGARLWHLDDASHVQERIREALPELAAAYASSHQTSPRTPQPGSPRRSPPEGDAMATLAPPGDSSSSPTSSSPTSSDSDNNAVPELTPRAPHQDSRSGAAGVLSGGTGGASSRGPS